MDQRLPDRLTAAEAAKAVGVSYATLKQWIYGKKIRSVRTPGGHHRIPVSEVARLRGAAVGPLPSLESISGRNKLAGIVTRVRMSGLLAEITMDIGGQSLTAMMTKTTAQRLQLRSGAPAVAVIKAMDVMVIAGQA